MGERDFEGRAHVDQRAAQFVVRVGDDPFLLVGCLLQSFQGLAGGPRRPFDLVARAGDRDAPVKPAAADPGRLRRIASTGRSARHAAYHATSVASSRCDLVRLAPGVSGDHARPLWNRPSAALLRGTLDLLWTEQ